MLPAPNVRKEWVLPSKLDSIGAEGSSHATTVVPIAGPTNTKGKARQKPSVEKDPLPIDNESSQDESADSTDDDDTDKRPQKRKAGYVDPYKDWDNGESLTPKQRKSIMALNSNYERYRAMNKLKNSRLLRELDMKAEVTRALEGHEGEGNVKRPLKDQDRSTKPTSHVTTG